MSKSYPLTGFSKISWEELMGIIEMLKLFSSLDDTGKEAITLMIDGMKYRESKQ